jgi:hypothetical protein
MSTTIYMQILGMLAMLAVLAYRATRATRAPALAFRQGFSVDLPQWVSQSQAWFAIATLASVTQGLPSQDFVPKFLNVSVMPRRVLKASSTVRRHIRADNILRFGFAAMRPCTACASRGVVCVTSSADERCEQCCRNQRKCDLASPWEEYEKIFKQKEELRERRLEAEMKAVRLRKQERLLQKKLRELGSREEQNILDLEADEVLMGLGEDAPQSEALGASSPGGLSQASFSALLNRTTPELQSSS